MQENGESDAFLLALLALARYHPAVAERESDVGSA
jgi:hypothetical protein